MKMSLGSLDDNRAEVNMRYRASDFTVGTDVILLDGREGVVVKKDDNNEYYFNVLTTDDEGKPFHFRMFYNDMRVDESKKAMKIVRALRHAVRSIENGIATLTDKKDEIENAETTIKELCDAHVVLDELIFEYSERI